MISSQMSLLVATKQIPICQISMILEFVERHSASFFLSKSADLVYPRDNGEALWVYKDLSEWHSNFGPQLIGNKIQTQLYNLFKIKYIHI